MATKRKAQLDASWIEDALLKLRSNYTNVVFFETDDLYRYRQFLRYMATTGTGHSIYELTPWKGLFHLGKNGFQPVSQGHGDRYALEAAQRMGMDSNIRGMAEILRHADRILKEGKAILLLRELDCHDGFAAQVNEDLVAAIRSWAVSHELMERESAVLCFCSGVAKVVDTHTASQCAVIEVDLGNDEERFFVMMSSLSSLQYDTKKLLAEKESQLMIERLVRLSAGLNLHQFGSALLESHQRDGQITVKRVANLKNKWIEREDVVEIMEPDGGFEMIGGSEAQKQFIRQTIVETLRRQEEAQAAGVVVPKGILLFGPPGTGKTLFAKAVAAETNLPFINLKTENLYRSLLGESGQALSRAIRIIEKNAPALVFIDEMDRFGNRNNNGGRDGASQETRKVFNQLLEWLGDDHRGSILIGTTNRPQDLDDAILRPGRLDYKIPMLYPDQKARNQILAIHFGLTGTRPQLPVAAGLSIEQVVVALAEMTENYSGAELAELVQRIRRLFFISRDTALTLDHVQQVVDRFTINHDQRRQEMATYRDLAVTYSDQSWDS